MSPVAWGRVRRLTILIGVFSAFAMFGLLEHHPDWAERFFIGLAFGIVLLSLIVMGAWVWTGFEDDDSEVDG